ARTSPAAVRAASTASTLDAQPRYPASSRIAQRKKTVVGTSRARTVGSRLSVKNCWNSAGGIGPGRSSEWQWWSRTGTVARSSTMAGLASELPEVMAHLEIDGLLAERRPLGTLDGQEGPRQEGPERVHQDAILLELVESVLEGERVPPDAA